MRASLHGFVAFAAVVAVAVASAPAAGAATVDVQIRDFLFRPALTQIEPGDEVRWAQGGGVTHTVTARAGAPQAFDSGDLQPGQQFSRVFAVPGRYAYHCTIHAEMRGVVQVGPDTTAPALKRVAGKAGPKRLRVSFRLSERAKVSVELLRRGKVVRRGTARTVDEGPRSTTVGVAGLKPGAYRARVRAVDLAGNVATVRAGTFAIATS